VGGNLAFKNFLLLVARMQENTEKQQQPFLKKYVSIFRNAVHNLKLYLRKKLDQY
jgi:hypothetical protein